LPPKKLYSGILSFFFLNYDWNQELFYRPATSGQKSCLLTLSISRSCLFKKEN